MYKNEFDNLLRQNQKFNAYMFYGASNFLIEHYTSLVASSLGNSDEIEKIYFDDYDFKQVKNKLLQSSLFTSETILIIKLEKKLNKKEVDSLINACEINKHSKIIFSCMGDFEFKVMSGYFTKKNNSVSIRMFQPFANEAISLIDNKAKELKIVCDRSALNHLYFMHKFDLSLCINDLAKLAILDQHITSDIINIHCFGIGSVNFEDFLFDLLDMQDISSDLQLLLESGMNEIYILNQITSFVQELFMISSYARSISTPNAKEILGFIPPKHIWEKRRRLAINIKPITFLTILQYLLNMELEFKSSAISNQNLFLQASLRKFKALFG